MGKLRMKETAQDRLARESSTDATSSSHRKKKRRKHSDKDSSRYYRSVSPEVQPAVKGKGRSTSVDSDSYVPPRPSKDRPYVPYTYDDEESQLPPLQARKRDKAREDEEFTQKLFDAMREDEGYEPYSRSAASAGYSYDYREALPDARAYGPAGVASDRYVDPESGFILNRVIFKDAMNDDDYAEHVRQGMFRRTRKEEIARQEAYEKERKLKEKKRAAAIAQQKALEEERLRNLEERARRKAQEGTVKSREAYQAAWARLVDPKRQTEQLRLEDFPWPISRESGGQLDAEHVKSFLLSHLDGGDLKAEELAKKRKQALRTAVLAYHPDRFERYVLRVQESQRSSVRDMGLRVSQILNQLLNEM